MSRYPNVDFKTKPRCPLSLVPKSTVAPRVHTGNTRSQSTFPFAFPDGQFGHTEMAPNAAWGRESYTSCPIILSERRWSGGDSLGYVPTRSVCRRQTQISSHGLPHCVTGSIQELFEVSVRAPPEAARTSLMAGIAKREHEGKNRGLL